MTSRSEVYSSTDPSGGAAAWHAVAIGTSTVALQGVAETLTGVDDHGAHTLDTAPAGARSSPTCASPVTRSPGPTAARRSRPA